MSQAGLDNDTRADQDDLPFGRDDNGWSGRADSRARSDSKGRKKRRSPWYLTALVVVGAALMVISAGTLALIYGLSNRYDSKTTHADILGDGTRNQNTNLSEGPLNYLVLGTDTRDVESSTSENSTGSRSDTILFVHVAKGLGSAFIVSFPRDSYVNVPAGGNWKGGMNKINSAFSFGGAALAAKTLVDLTGIKLDGAMIINFAGVVDMVNAVGGVHVCVPYDVPNYFKDYPQYANGWPKGCYDMGGEEAEIFMRQRHDVPGGDFGRIISQQLVMKALMGKATSSGMLTSPSKLDSLLVAVAKSLTIDKSMNLRDLAFSLKGIKPNNVQFATVPYIGTFATPAGSSVQLNQAADQQLFKAILDDKTAQWLAAHPQPKVATYGQIQ
jgi:LCP family protein required for cell wall assembly